MADLKDDFKGDTPHLIRCIEALVELDAKGALVPHGIGGHARDLLSASAVRLSEIVDDASYELGTLLNHIHGDQGQYVAVHGWKKAAVDALVKLSPTGATEVRNFRALWGGCKRHDRCQCTSAAQQGACEHRDDEAIARINENVERARGVPSSDGGQR